MRHQGRCTAYAGATQGAAGDQVPEATGASERQTGEESVSDFTLGVVGPTGEAALLIEAQGSGASSGCVCSQLLACYTASRQCAGETWLGIAVALK